MRPRFALVGTLHLALVSCAPSSKPAPEPAPVEATLLYVRKGKPPLRSYATHLTLVNRHDREVWLLFPYNGDEDLPPSRVFTTENSPAIPFVSTAHDGPGGRVVGVRMLGTPGFRAFRLPARGRVVFENFAFPARSPVEEIPYWEVSALVVDDDAPLERWLPYETLSDPDVRLPEDNDEAINLDWDYEQSRRRDDYPNQPVRQVTAEVLQRSTIRLGAALR
ncbi:MAG: hypothetical protein R3A79_21490 [Nannocystaceae bacterium]